MAQRGFYTAALLCRVCVADQAVHRYCGRNFVGSPPVAEELLLPAGFCSARFAGAASALMSGWVRRPAGCSVHTLSCRSVASSAIIRQEMRHEGREGGGQPSTVTQQPHTHTHPTQLSHLTHDLLSSFLEFLTSMYLFRISTYLHLSAHLPTLDQHWAFIKMCSSSHFHKQRYISSSYCN